VRKGGIYEGRAESSIVEGLAAGNKTMMAFASRLASLPSQHDTRQLPGFASGTGQTLTPDQLAQIDLSNKSSVTPWVVGVNVAGIVLITAVVSIRLAVRHFMIHQFFSDDRASRTVDLLSLLCPNPPSTLEGPLLNRRLASASAHHHCDLVHAVAVLGNPCW
jgi:hypothetical protein